MEDMIKKLAGLNPRQRKFCLLRTSGMSQIDAYKKAGYKGDYDDASHLEAEGKIKQEITRIQDKQEQKIFDLQAECQKSDPTNIAILRSIANDPKTNPGAKIAAIRELLDRGHGKPKEKVEVEGDKPVLNIYLPNGRKLE